MSTRFRAYPRQADTLRARYFAMALPWRLSTSLILLRNLFWPSGPPDSNAATSLLFRLSCLDPYSGQEWLGTLVQVTMFLDIAELISTRLFLFVCHNGHVSCIECPL